MIATGQLCLLIGEHSRAGETCVVTGPLRYSAALHVRSGQVVECLAFDISLARPGDEIISQWVATASELLPLVPPQAPNRDDLSAADPIPDRVEQPTSHATAPG